MATQVLAPTVPVFGYTTDNNVAGFPSFEYFEAKNSTSATINAGDLVIATLDGSNNPAVGRSLHTSTGEYIVGVALDTFAQNTIGKVLVRGYAQVNVGSAGVTAGQLITQDGTTDGGAKSIASGSVTAAETGTFIGVALQTEASGTAWCYIKSA